MRKSTTLGVMILVLLIIGLTGCLRNPAETPSVQGVPGDEIEGEPEQEPGGGASEGEGPPPGEGEEAEGVTVESLEIITLESFPPQIMVMVRGVINESCKTVGEVFQSLDGFTFYLEVTTEPTAMDDCPPELPAPFEMSVLLDHAFVEAGTWTVVAGSATATFETEEVDLEALYPEEEEAGPGGMTLYALAMVDSIEPVVDQGPPVQVSLRVLGNLNDGCTELDGVLQQRQDSSVLVYLQVERPADAECIQVVTPFETTIQLEGEFLPGTYMVTVNDEAVTTFTVE